MSSGFHSSLIMYVILYLFFVEEAALLRSRNALTVFSVIRISSCHKIMFYPI